MSAREQEYDQVEGTSFHEINPDDPATIAQLSPLALQACESQGVFPEELLRVSDDDILERYPEIRENPHLLPVVRDAFERKRVQRVNDCTAEQNRLAQRLANSPPPSPSKVMTTMLNKEHQKTERMINGKRREFARQIQHTFQRQMRQDKAQKRAHAFARRAQEDEARKKEAREERSRYLAQREEKRNQHIEMVFAEQERQLIEKGELAKIRQIKREKRLENDIAVAKERRLQKEEARLRRHEALTEALEREREEQLEKSFREAERKLQVMEQEKLRVMQVRQQKAERVKLHHEECMRRVEAQDAERHAQLQARVDAYWHRVENAEERTHKASAEKQLMAKLTHDERSDIRRRKEKMLEYQKNAMIVKMEASEHRLQQAQSEHQRVIDQRALLYNETVQDEGKLHKLLDMIEATPLDELDMNRVDKQAKKLGISNLQALLVEPTGHPVVVSPSRRLKNSSPRRSPRRSRKSSQKRLSYSPARSASQTPKSRSRSGSNMSSPSSSNRKQKSRSISAYDNVYDKKYGAQEISSGPQSMYAMKYGQTAPLTEKKKKKKKTKKSRAKSQGGSPRRSFSEKYAQESQPGAHIEQKAVYPLQTSSSAAVLGKSNANSNSSKTSVPRAQAERVIENMAVKQNSKLMRMLEDELAAENQRINLLRAVTDPVERERLQLQFKHERALARQSVQELSDRHDQELHNRMTQLGLL